LSEKPKKDDQGKKPFEWTPEIIKALLESLVPYVDKYLLMKERESTQDNKFIETTSKHDRRIIYVLLSFLGSVIIGMSILTYFGKVSGEALLFAVGGIVGYIFALIKRFIFGSQRSVTENSNSE